MTSLQRHVKEITIRGVGVLSCQVIEPGPGDISKLPVTVNVTNSPPWPKDDNDDNSVGGGGSAPMGTLVYALPGNQRQDHLSTLLIEDPQTAELAQRLSKLLVKSIQRPVFLTLSVYGLPSDSFTLDHDLDDSTGDIFLNHPQIALIKQVVQFVSSTITHGIV